MGEKMKTVVGIPARMGSSRFPGKPLAKILGMSMIEHVYTRCCLAGVDDVFVATCDTEILQAVHNFGGKAYITSKDISRPGLRIAAACKQMHIHDNDIVVIVQGDEPLVNPEMINIAVDSLLDSPDIFCVNLAADLTEKEWLDPNEIKVVVDADMNALFMSRSPIPSKTRDVTGPRLKQVCIMPFRKKNLMSFQSMLPSSLELAESIEMLRAIEYGLKVRMVKTQMITKSVDNKDDLRVVEELMKKDPIYEKYGF